jgi:hypothetical protein
MFKIILTKEKSDVIITMSLNGRGRIKKREF